jgi:predicted CXXCH cytochrome family protein
MTIQGSPVTISLACLSCHDGTTAFDSLLNFPGASDGSDWSWNGANKIANTATSFMGTDLSNDHPISITYDPTATPDATEWNTANAQNYVNGIPLFDGRVECGSCHNPHDDQFGVFLRASNSGSALCLKCHIK